ncbi:MAG: amidophosphoribosyltransferase [Planctomycetes bacterium]|nr:amidophosphoribosyltransferase [Planctomycetota bacterium]
MCGIVGVCGPEGTDAVLPIYDSMVTLQHRGQDAAGIVTCDLDGRFHIKKGEGLVREIFREKNIRRLRGRVGIGHVRYPTFGSGSGEDAQPFFVPNPYGVAMAHNGNVVNFAELISELKVRDLRHCNSGCDVEILLHVFASAMERDGNAQPTPDQVFRAVGEVFRRVHGAYSVVTLVGGAGLLVFRDPHGIRPLLFGRLEGPQGPIYAAASESVALGLLGFKRLEDVRPGEAVLFTLDGKVHRRVLDSREHAPCIFELIYFSRPDSITDGASVYEVRLALGRALAARWAAEGEPIDAVIPVPHAACTAAIELASRLGVPYREGLVKNRYVGRTFIMPEDADRRRLVRQNFSTVPSVLAGKDVLLLDDSIVRGNTVYEIIEMVRAAGAKKVYFASYSAPLRHPCVYGIDMVTRKDFVARGREVEEIGREIGADRLVYLTLEEMLSAARSAVPGRTGFCTGCFSGKYPTGDVSEYAKNLEEERETMRRLRQLEAVSER